MKHEAIVFIEISGEVVPAGKLKITEDGRFSKSEFDYGRKYLQRPDAVAIDPVQLPLRDTHFVTDEDFVLFNGIRDASPDAWGRSLIDLYMRRSHGRLASEAEYLLVSQRGARIGGLQFGPTPDRPAPVLDISLPDISSDLGTIEAFQEMVDHISKGETVPESLLDFIAPGADLGGARPKGTVTINGFPWLVKFGIERDRINMAAAEAACLDLCEMVGISACERQVITVSGRDALVLKRFDRHLDDNGVLHRKHMISGLTMLGAHEMDRGRSGYSELYDGMRKFGKIDGVGEQIYRRMVMNVIVGNTDDHYRNHAFLLNKTGQFEMSPVYDVTPTLQASPSRNMFFHLGKPGSGREATLEKAIAGAPSLGISCKDAIEIAREMGDIVAKNWRRALSERGMPQSDIDLLQLSFSEAEKVSAFEDPFCIDTPQTENSIDQFQMKTSF